MCYSSSNEATVLTNTYKKSPFKVQKQYDRLLFMADLMNPPHCFVVLTNNSSQPSKDMYLYCQTQIIIGSCYYIFEPDVPANTLGAYTPIITTNHPLLPLKTHSFLTSVPPTPVQGFGDQTYSIQLGVKINLFAAQMRNKTVCCSGIACDRQNILEKNKSCGTLWKEKHRKALVLDIGVSFSLENTTKEITIQHFRSFRFSQIFLKDMDKFGDISEEALREYQLILRKQIRKLQDKVNNEDGWKIVFWQRKGEVTDEADSTEKIESTETSYHIAYLFPAKPGMITSTIWIASMLSYDNPLEDSENETNNENETSASKRKRPRKSSL